MGDLRGQAASDLSIDGVLEGLRFEVQWGAGWSRGGVLAERLPFLIVAFAVMLVMIILHQV
jgi:hypothetical protein